MDKQLEYLYLSPLHINDISQRLKGVTLLKDHILSTVKSFQHYSDAVAQIISCMKKISASIASYPEFSEDRTINSISSLLMNFSENFSLHSTQLQCIISKLKQFAQKEVADAEEKGKKAKKDIDAYFKATENYASLSKKKPQMTREEANTKIKTHHWNAALSDFQYQRALELVDRSKSPEIAAQFLMFINSADALYLSCHDNIDSSKETLNLLNIALSDPSTQIKNFDEETTNLQKSLESLYKVYWRRLDPESENTTHELEYEGYLWKKGSGITKSWQKRYFICRDHQLAYYHNAEDSDKPSGALPLLLTTIKPINDNERYNTFTIINQQKTYTLQALTTWDMNEWICVIKNNTQHLLENPSLTNAQTSNNPEIGEKDKSASPSSFEFNKKCADCGAEMPDWCCINWGTCVCINCSGAHRNLTTSVSKVRSLTLDKLSVYNKKLLELIGNENANRFLEACLDPKLKIDQNASKEDREEFIQMKYKKCVFVAQRGQHDEQVDIYNSIRKRELLSVYKDMCTLKYLQANNELLYQTLIEKSGYKNYTPLHLAASIGDPLICHLIALNMEDPSVLDDGGWSALSYAAYYGRSEVAEVLLKDGVDPKKTVENHPYYIARSKNRIDMATMFLPYWDDDEKVAPKQFVPPVAISDNEESENANSRYASLEALGKMNMNFI